jgi:hypothetical protein
MNRRASVTTWLLWTLLSIALLVGAYFAGQHFGFLSIAGAPTVTHTYHAFGHDFDVTSDFQTYDPFSSPGGSNLHTCDKSVSDDSSNTSISVTENTHNGATSCNSRLDLTIKITDLDLSKYKSVVIHRSGTASGAGDANRAGYSTDINGDAQLTHSAVTSTNYGTAAGSLGDIYVTNNGVNILIQASPENPTGALYPANKATYLTNTISAFGGQTTGATASLTYKITGIDATPLINSPLNLAMPASWLANVINQLSIFLSKTFTTLFTFSIVGPTTITPGQALAYQLSLAEPYPVRADYTQGVYEQRWCSAALIDKNQNIINELPFENCTGTWNKTYTITVPSGAYTDYAIVAVMLETRQDYANGAWTTTYQNQVVSKESLSLTSKVLIAPTTANKPSAWSSFWTGLIAWFKSILP